MLQMADDLRAFLEGRVVQAYATGNLARFQKWVARNRALSASLAASILLALTTLVVVVVQQGSTLRQVQAEQARTAKARDDAIANEERAAANAELAWRESYVANIIAAEASLRANEVHAAKGFLQDSREALRGWEWRHLSLLADSSLRRLRGHEGNVLSVAYHPSGEQIVSCSVDGTARLWNAADGSEIAVLSEHQGDVVSASFGPGGPSPLHVRRLGGPDDAHLGCLDRGARRAR